MVLSQSETMKKSPDDLNLSSVKAENMASHSEPVIIRKLLSALIMERKRLRNLLSVV